MSSTDDELVKALKDGCNVRGECRGDRAADCIVALKAERDTHRHTALGLQLERDQATRARIAAERERDRLLLRGTEPDYDSLMRERDDLKSRLDEAVARIHQLMASMWTASMTTQDNAVRAAEAFLATLTTEPRP